MSTRTSSKTRRTNLTLFAAALLASLCLAGPAPAHAGDWKWSVTPYVWATDVGVDVTIQDQRVVDDTIEFQDLLDDLDWAAQLHVEAQHGAHGVMFDYFGVKLSDEDSRFALPMPAGAEAVLDSTIEMSIIELGGIFDLGGDQQGFELLYGTRILTDRATLETEFDLGSATMTRHDESSDTLADALFGVRYQKQLSRRWGCLVRTDASTGGTDLTWSAAAAAGYTLGDSGRYMLTAGYRYMSIKYDVDEPVEATLTMSGAFTGLRLSF